VELKSLACRARSPLALLRSAHKCHWSGHGADYDVTSLHKTCDIRIEICRGNSEIALITVNCNMHWIIMCAPMHWICSLNLWFLVWIWSLRFLFALIGCIRCSIRTFDLILRYIRTDFFCVLRICSFSTFFFFRLHHFIRWSDAITPFSFETSPLSQEVHWFMAVRHCAHEFTSERAAHIITFWFCFQFVFVITSTAIIGLPYASTHCDHDCDSLPSSARSSYWEISISFCMFVRVMWQRSTLFPWHHNCLAAWMILI